MNTVYRKNISLAGYIKLAALTVCMVLLLAGLAGLKAHADGGVNMITTAGAEIKDAPSDSGNVVGLLPAGTTIEATGNGGSGWYEFTYEGEKRYVSAGKLTLADDGQAAQAEAVLGAGYSEEINSNASGEAINNSIGKLGQIQVTDIEGNTFMMDLDNPGNIQANPGTIEPIEGADVSELPAAGVGETLPKNGDESDISKALEEEFEQASDDIDEAVDQAERKEKIKISSVIGKIVIALVIIAMFAVGILTALARTGKIDIPFLAKEKEPQKKAKSAAPAKKKSNGGSGATRTASAQKKPNGGAGATRTARPAQPTQPTQKAEAPKPAAPKPAAKVNKDIEIVDLDAE